MTKKYKPNEEQYNIENIVSRYQSGDSEAGGELLSIYGGEFYYKNLSLYIGKYYKMIRYGKLDFKDRDSRLFIRLFMEDENMRKEMSRSYQYKATKKAAVRKLASITESMKVVENEDLKQDLCMLLLQQAMRYKKTNRTFGGYLYNSYRFAVANHIIKLLKPAEPYIHMPKELMRIADDRLKDDTSDIKINDSIFTDAPMIFMDEELGNSWVRGITCGDEFKNLSPLQRMIIKLNYYDGWSDGKIADMMGIHINTIFRQRKKADKIVQDTVHQLLQEDNDE